ncbi:unnamed protein product [Cyclocybe aegerita]|uniref:Ubiquitin-like domain-containing protein n=1 Tax=Cyclocybe aegerita TaxID=1973307 RepID=A0A8S0X9H3_CYCAE|nr:unnamed protein product [Cyclocybe aegerita]
MALAPSIGDLVTLGTVISSIVKAVNETSGASAEYKELVDELNSFCNMLTIMRRTLENATISPDNELAFNSIHMEMNRCRALVDAFVDTIKPYHRALNAAGGTSRRRHSLRVIFRKVWWALFREDVSKVQTRMMSHRLQIVFLLTSLSVPVTQAAVSNQVTTQVGYSRETGLEIIDFMGESFVFPWELCHSWEKMSLAIQAYYKHKPGQQEVEWGDYTLFCEDLGGIQVDRHYPFRHVRKGMRLRMAALTWRATDNGRLSQYECTRCHRRLPVHDIVESGWVEWKVFIRFRNPSLTLFYPASVAIGGRRSPCLELKGTPGSALMGTSSFGTGFLGVMSTVALLSRMSMLW